MHLTRSLLLAALASAVAAAPTTSAPETSEAATTDATTAPTESSATDDSFTTQSFTSGGQWTNPCPTAYGKYQGPNKSKCFPLIIDADAETDDLLAVLYALKTPFADIRGMAVPGIGWAHGTAAANLVDFADKLRPGSKIPVSIGNGVNLFEADLAAKLTAEGAVDPNPGCKYQKTVNEGFTGRTDSDLLFGLQWMVPRSTRKWRDLRNYKSADQDITDWINTAFTQTGKKVTILITGPGTDVALALRTTPTLTQKIERIVWMGGAIDVPGNMFSLPANTVAEFNIFLDCVAAKELFSNPGLHITLVPLDFTNNLVLDAKFMTALQAAGQKTWEAKFAYELLDVNRDTWFGGETAFYQQYTIWDPLAAAVMFNQAGNVTFENMKIRQVCGTDLLGGILDITKDAQTVRELSPTYVGANVTVAKTLQKGATITDYPVVKNFLAALTA